jgi:subtilase family serine protease
MAALFIAPCSAVYSFEGIPFEITAQGAVRGDVVNSGRFGLDAPPYTHTFTLDQEPVWARVYTGVWGGTEQYKGWAQVDINGNRLEKITLYGKDDVNEQVYASGNGVYWIVVDAAGLLSKGENTITVTTSRGEQNNKLDGRVYGILVVALVETPDGPITQYWIADGNENLHGEGWAGINPTRHDECAVIFPGISGSGVRSADLTTLLLTSTQGQPDYVTFNQKDLGIYASPAADYLSGARDIGNERSGDASGKGGTDSRYADLEVFDVASLISGSNEVTFERGRDLDGDGSISTSGTLSEGEDYIHPVLAMLTVHREGSSLPTDVSVDPVTITGAYEGEMAAIRTTIRNSGLVTAVPAKVIFSVDGNPVDTQQVTLGYQGISDVQGTWQAFPGDHTVSVSVAATGDPVSSNNVASRSIRVGSPPDLSVSLGDPGDPGATGTAARSAPFPLAGACAGGIALLWWIRRRRPAPSTLPALLLACGVVVLALTPVVSGAAGGISEFSVPVTIRNTGGSDAPEFLLSLYLDGEKVAEHAVPGGVPAGGIITVTVPLFTTPGRHTLRVVADERATIPERDRTNNGAERTYEFS